MKKPNRTSVKTLYIIHRWDGSPEADWYPWLKNFAEKMGLRVEVLKMPHPRVPTIKSWVKKLRRDVKLSSQTYFVGHSIGCQTILRFLAGQTAPVGGIMLVAPWLTLQNLGLLSKIIARPWLGRPIDWQKARASTKNKICVFSDNDQSVPIENAALFEKKLNAKIIMTTNKGHLTAGGGVLDLEFLENDIKEFLGEKAYEK